MDTAGGITRKRLAIEAIALLVSVFLALAVNAWWDGRKAHAVQRSQLTNLRDDFEQARAEMQEKLHYHTIIASSVEDFRGRLEAERLSTIVMVPDTLIIALLSLPTLDLSNATLEELEMSARVSTISNVELRRMIVAWPRVLHDAFWLEQTARTLNEDHLIPLLRVSTDLADAFALLPQWVKTGVDPGREVQMLPVRNSLPLRNVLAERRLRESWAADPLQESTAHVDSILALIDEELGS